MKDPCFLKRNDFQQLLDCLQHSGYRCIGPQVRDDCIVYDEVTSIDQLPQGVHDLQIPARYQLKTSDSNLYFAWANGAQALKPLMFAPRETLWRAERDAQGKLQFVETLPKVQPTAVIGVRSCDLAALAVQDNVFCTNNYQDPYYTKRRESLFTVAVNCSHPADTCFCASTGDGPVAKSGYDLVLDELAEGFLLVAGSEAGEKIMAQLPLHKATDQQHYEAGQQNLHAEQVQKRALPNAPIADILLSKPEDPQWQAIADRCLACGNCTMVCPTCFCHSEADAPELDGSATTHFREWDSCFTQGHSYIHGVVVRDQIVHRYRQWLTHKLASWYEQFGQSGCVGCGRCITWCPTAIDITVEVNKMCGEDEG